MDVPYSQEDMKIVTLECCFMRRLLPSKSCLLRLCNKLHLIVKWPKNNSIILIIAFNLTALIESRIMSREELNPNSLLRSGPKLMADLI